MGCSYCNEDSDLCEIYFDDFVNSYVLKVETCEYDYSQEEFLDIYINIKYCPYCGRKLGDKNV